ncbi:MAG: response regulator, partial [Planctomycetales bacterium]|nr:response regulator [Planctomycetales bacterium]
PQLSTSTTSPHGDELTRSHRTNPSAGPTILLVEDQEENQMVTVEQLRLLGYTVAVANNGQTALQLLATPTHTFQLVLMDCQMPEMDGLETTRQIRGQEAGTNQHIPIVAMTAQVMPGDKERCYAVGMDDYLAKPLRIGELRNVL